MSPYSATKILILEDEQAIADAILFSLKREGYSTKHVITCGEAHAELSSTPYQLAIFDVGLPDGSGFDLCKQVRQFSEVPILFLSARSDEVDRVVGLEIGADDYITKPFSPRELVARVKANLRRTAAEKNPRFSREAPQVSEVPIENSSTLTLLIDEVTCKASFHSQPLHLTKAEYQLLKALYQQPGRVYSREQLLERISDDPGASMDRVIDAHIKSIRAKLKDIHQDGAALIETRRGLGYCMRKPS